MEQSEQMLDGKEKAENDADMDSQKLAEYAFQCLWYNRKYTDIRQCLCILIMRSQKPISITALGLFDIRQCLCILIMRSQKPISITALGLFELSYASFILVMRFTFSLYTFLDNFAEK
ncbi:7tm Odorant receptor [Popillia japonica]|uniref:7tm Odorant receptor n=1 Tax=Popillia japonica TaxID=7064 RepID=A0AAW1I9P5_POPJA